MLSTEERAHIEQYLATGQAPAVETPEAPMPPRNVMVPAAQAERIIEILSDLHDEAVDDDPEYAQEIDALCGALTPTALSRLYTVVYQCEEGYFHEYTARAQSEQEVLDMVNRQPDLPPLHGTPITVVVHGDVTESAVNTANPATIGEYLFFRDPADDVSTGWHRVVSAPDLTGDNEGEYDDDTYADAVIGLVNDEGGNMEAFARELSRNA